jgi:hypothetical protein
MLAAPADEFDPGLLGRFAHDPPAEFLPLLEEMAADVRTESYADCAAPDGRGRPARPAAAHRRADPADLGDLSRGLPTGSTGWFVMAIGGRAIRD